MITIKTTVGDVLDKLDMNGYPWVKNAFIDWRGNSCAMGQVARNFGLVFDANTNSSERVWSLNDKLQNISEAPYSLISYNDSHAISYEDVVQWAHLTLDEFRDVEIEF